MKLCFLIERQYPPYSKWFGTGFARLRCAGELAPMLERVLAASTWRDRERELSAAYLVVQRMHNELRVTPPIEPRVESFHNRPYQVPHAGRFVEALYGAIQVDAVKALPKHVGAVWQYTNTVDVLEDVSLCRRLCIDPSP